MNGNTVKAIELQSLDSSTITLGAYYAVNAAGIEGALSSITINNASNTDIYIGMGKKEDHFYLQAGKILPVSFQSGATPPNYVSKLPKNTIIYVRGLAGLGNIYVSGLYNE